ncbi:MAG TPA: hypothetical protein VMZ53_16720 [Kofleriaceae bacterium]|nr:hypothetical protein [Kofleriaceae bacterium]
MGWLDERTVVVLADGIVATVTVDGTRTEVAKLDQSYDTLVVTQAGEAWAARCAEPPERRKPGPCNQEFLRVIPAPQAQSVKAPEGIVPHRVMRGSDELVRIPFKEVAAPAGVELHQIPLSSPKGFIVTGISCTSPGGSSKFPDVAALPAMGYAASESRWVLEKPPIYQVVAATQHRSHTAVQVNYFRPCEARPLDGFYAFGDGVWAEYLATRDHGTWTFRVEDKVIGTVSGSAGLRPNHDVSP